MFTYEIDDNLNNIHDSLVNHPAQSKAFGDFYSKQHNCKQRIIKIFFDGSLVAQLLYFIKGKGSETISGFLGGKFVNMITQEVFPEIVWYSGPIFVGNVNKEEITNYIIHSLGKEHDVKKITADLSFLYGFNKWATYKINLEQSEEMLWKRIDKSARKNINKTQDLVSVFFVNDKESVMKYLKLLNDSRKHLGFVYLPPTHINDLLVECFKDNAQVVLVIEKCSGLPVAAMGYLSWGETCIEVGSAISHYCRKAKLYCGDLIKWEIIKYAKLNGLKWYDLGGCSPSPSNEKEVSIRKFKEKFGGDYYEYGVLR